MNWRLTVKLLVLVMATLFAISLCVPFFTINPRLGELTGLAAAFKPDLFASTTYSILGSIGVLWKESEEMLAILIFVFSVLLPTMKFTAYWIEARDANDSRLYRVSKMVSKYSMVEVFLVAFTILAFRTLPGGTTLVVELGLWLFAISVVVSLFIPAMLRRAKIVEEAEAGTLKKAN